MAMAEGFRVSRELTLPPEAATWVNAFVAKRNAGKTHDAAVLREVRTLARFVLGDCHHHGRVEEMISYDVVGC